MDGLAQFFDDVLYLISVNGAEDLPKLVAYGIPLIIAWTVYVRIKNQNQQRTLEELRAREEAGMAEPVSLHPVIDYAKCLGCGTCVSACPEEKVLGIVNDKARLINPASCIGHGACRVACSQDAITLVFGSAKRGVDIPVLSPEFETNIPGIFIAGELGGMGLIRNAVAQGRQAVEAIARKPGIGKGKALDLVIIGAGPAGISASLEALVRRMRSVTLEQDSLGGTVAHYPRGKIVMTSPVELPIYGRVNFRETNKESLISLWQDVVDKTGLRIQYQERMDTITHHPEGFVVETSQHRYLTRNVLLCIGRRGTPRRLGVPGENLSKVTYSLTDPEQYRGQRVIVVGGGNSALEAAIAIAQEPDSSVILSYRAPTFSRAAPKNMDKLKMMQESGLVRVLMESELKNIEEKTVTLSQQDRTWEEANDQVIICAGGVLPTPLLKKIGIEVETKYGTA